MASWFQNYLQNRKQAVVIKGKKSEYKTIPSGVPQLLECPLLILIYINDIIKNTESVISHFCGRHKCVTWIAWSRQKSSKFKFWLGKKTKKNWAKQWKVNFNKEKIELLTFKKDNHPVIWKYCSRRQGMSQTFRADFSK